MSIEAIKKKKKKKKKKNRSNILEKAAVFNLLHKVA